MGPEDGPHVALRECGACAACCFIPAVPELSKDVYQDCAHSRVKLGRPLPLVPAAPAVTGCEVYADRPRACREYRCLWLDDAVGEEQDRPDRLGLMFDLPSAVQDHPDYAGVKVVCAREVRGGARDGARAAGMLTRLAGTFVVRVTDPGGRTVLMGPRAEIALVARRAAERRG